MPRHAAPIAAAVSLALVATFAAPARAAFDIVINPGSGLSGNAAALAAFNRAAAQWEARFTDDILVTIDGDLTTAGFSSPNIIGQAASVQLTIADYQTTRQLLVNDAANEPSNAIVASLPATFTATLPPGATLSGSFLASKANLKALNVTGLDDRFGDTDAEITFNSAFTFDYDNRNGVTGTDFETVAVHEIGHALGFLSEVDFLDGTTEADAVEAFPNTLDLFRFANNTANDPTAATFGTAARDLRPGVDAIFDDGTTEYRFSTGEIDGDGRQASHWKDNDLTGVYIGVMDPTLGGGQVFPITNADLRAFDLIGYDLAVIPEPATLAVVGGALAVALRRRRPIA